MPTIALVANDRNLVTSVSVTLESEGYNFNALWTPADGLENHEAAYGAVTGSAFFCG
jgi:hypothetical protein